MVHAGIKKAISERFDEELKFFKGWIDKPKAVGAIIPTSSHTAKRMACVVQPESGLPVLELGPGTGVITKAILARGVKPGDLWSIEYSEDFVVHLREQFPDVNIIQGDAFNLDATLGEHAGQTFDSIISAVPLLSFKVPQRIRYVESLLDRIPAGRPIVQITYGTMSPVPPGKGNYTVDHFDFMLRNIPPAQLWIYRRPWKV